jgi:hypothetical protein
MDFLKLIGYQRLYVLEGRMCRKKEKTKIVRIKIKITIRVLGSFF